MSRWFFAFACLFLLFCQGLCLSLCTFSYLGRHGQFFELTTHFQPFYFVFALLLLGLSLCLCLLLKPVQKRISFAVLLSVLPAMTLIGSGYRLYPYFLSAQQKTAAGSEKLTLLHCNLWGGRNRDRLSFLSLVQKEKPDLVAVCEVEDKWHGLLSTSLKQAYPYCITFPHVGGVELYSRYPLEGEVRLSERGHRPRIFAHVHLGRQVVSLVVAHPPTPVGEASRLKARNREFEIYALECSKSRDEGLPYLVIGDLNCTPWSPYFRKLLREGALNDCGVGMGLMPTWPNTAALTYGLLPGNIGTGAVLPIDHCLVSRDLTVLEKRVLGPVGSDHLPILVRLALPAGKS